MAYHLSGTVLGAEEEPNTDPALQSLTDKERLKYWVLLLCGAHGLWSPPQPLCLLGPPSFLDLPPE